MGGILVRLGIALSCFIFGFTAEAQDCETILGDFSGHDSYLIAKFEKRSFIELFASDPKQNLVVQNPMLAMSAAQRVMSVINYAGWEYKNIRGKGRLKVYNLFSTPSVLNDYQSIVGQEDRIAEFVESIKDSVRGAPRVAMFLGPHGTGKTLILTILQAALKYASFNLPGYAFYEPEWHNLHAIPGLEFIQEGEVVRAGLHQSPLVMLPDAIRSKIIEMAAPEVMRLAGSNPKPLLKPDPQNLFIYEKLMASEQLKKKSDLTVAEIVETLGRHIVLRRKFFGENNNNIFDAQGRDYDQGAIFASKNPAIFLTYGPEMPFSYFMGQIPASNGGPWFGDEFLRNADALRDMFLRSLESREIKIGAAPAWPLDLLMIMATNTANFDAAMSDSKGHAHRDRFQLIPFYWLIQPHQIAKTMLLMFKSVFVQPLTGENKIVKADLNQIFPLIEADKPILGTEDRYSLYLDEGEDRIHVSPRALLFMSTVVSITRQNFSNEEASKKQNSSVINSALFRDPITRSRYLTGEMPIENSIEEKELNELSLLLQDGNHGLSQRDVSGWLAACVAAARAPENHHDLTIKIAKDTFKMMLSDGKKLEYGNDEKTRQLWIHYSNLVSSRLTIPKIENDVLASAASEESLIKRAYDETTLEISALGADPSATEYLDPLTQQRKPIRILRLEKIRQKYLEIHSERLDINTLAMAQFALTLPGRTVESTYYQPLLTAIQAVFAQQASESSELMDVVQRYKGGVGDSQDTVVYGKIMSGLLRRGYCPHCAEEALGIFSQNEVIKRQLKDRKPTQ